MKIHRPDYIRGLGPASVPFAVLIVLFHAMEAPRVTNVAEVIAVGDTPLDLQAGTNEGVRGMVGVLSGASKEDRLRPEPHTDILSSVAELPTLIASKY